MTMPLRPQALTSLGAGLLLSLGILAPALPAQAEDDDHYTLGLGAALGPEFLGSDEMEVSPVPLVDIKYGRLFAKVGDGIGVNVLEIENVTAGIAVDWMGGYDDDDVPNGIEEVDGALGARLFVATELYGVNAGLSVTQAVTDTDRGLIVDASLGYPIHITDRFTVSPGISTSWANGKYMDGYFGINASEAAASGLAYYKPSSGFRDVSAKISANYRVTDHISTIGMIGVTQLVGDAADSPLVEEETSLKLMLGVAYTF
jgi:MipA family protein